MRRRHYRKAKVYLQREPYRNPDLDPMLPYPAIPLTARKVIMVMTIPYAFPAVVAIN